MIVELNILRTTTWDPMNDEKSTKIIWFLVDIQADYGETVRRSNHKNMKEEPIWYVRFEY